LTRESEELTVERKLVVVFDICSSTTILEDLKRTDNLAGWRNLLIGTKDFLRRESEKLGMELYKFIGDGWVLLFPDTIDRVEFCFFLQQLSRWFDAQFETTISPLLSHPPNPIGLMFGVDSGELVKLEMDERIEYLGRAINVAARLQANTKELDGGPSYKALFSKNSLNSPVPRPANIIVQPITLELRNISPSRIDCLVFEALEISRARPQPARKMANTGSRSKGAKSRSTIRVKKTAAPNHFEAWNKAQEIWTRPAFRELRSKVFERLRDSSIPWTQQDVTEGKEVARLMDEFAHLSQFLSEGVMIDTWDDPLAKAWIVLEPIVKEERAKQDWAEKWRRFEEMGQKALAKLVREGRDPLRELRLGEITFDYLPGSPLAHGWALRETNNPPTFSANEKHGLSISAKERYALDYEPKPPNGLCGRVELSARYSADAVVYLKVLMEGREAKDSKIGWIAFRLGNGGPKKEAHNEWAVYVAGSERVGWVNLRLPLHYYVAQTFGTDQRLVYKELLGLRLRGSLDISPIQFIR
jgi:hypothetical protein